VEWRKSQFSECVLGVGTVFDSTSAGTYIDLGADYVVGPTFNPEVAKTCNRRKVLYIPGCFTPTEISNAEEMGADIIKLFPASVATPSLIKAILGPMPHTRIMPSGGVRMNQKEITEWVKAGAVAVNMGSDLIRKEHVETGHFDTISRNVEECIRWVEEAKSLRI
jgi:2-dehydro-3-deoxyphosphogluconate aldolase/(4S)-4-hydroxy-2-oxoglutarate aldolase